MDWIFRSESVLLHAAAAVVALGVLYRFAASIYQIAWKFHEMFDLVQHELRSNAGSSLRDAVDRIEERMDSLESPKVEINIEKEEP